MQVYQKRLNKLQNKVVFGTGCGNKIDFMHFAILIPYLKELNSKIIIGSYSLNKVSNYPDAEVIWAKVIKKTTVKVKKIYANTKYNDSSPINISEITFCQYLDTKYPDDAPHFVYEYHSRFFNINLLTELYNFIVDLHNVEGVIAFNSSNGSLIKGNESEIDDPIREQITMATINNLDNNKIKEKILVVIGYGNYINDEDSLKSISELTIINGFLGTFALIKDSDEYCFYKDLFELNNQLITDILLSAEGNYEDNINILFSILFFFDIKKIAERSLIINIIKDCETVISSQNALEKFRLKINKNKNIKKVNNQVNTKTNVINTNLKDLKNIPGLENMNTECKQS
jgi:hypothetical protein